MNFRILLIVPSQAKVYGMKIFPAHPPLGILYVGAMLENIGAEVKLIDVDADRMSIDAILSYVKGFSPNIIGITATTPLIEEAYNIASFIKKHFSVPIVLGGIHPTMNPEECIKQPCIDFVVKGEGEETIRELVLEMRSSTPDFSKVKGMYYKRGQDIHFSGERDLILDLDKIPFPARRLLNNPSRYKPQDAEHLPVASIMTTRGCPGRCTFCCTKNIFKDRYRMRSIDNVIEEIDELIRCFKVKEIHIADDAFNIDKNRTLMLCEAIRRKNYNINFEFLNGLRADFIDDDILDAFKSIGIKNVAFGVESVDGNILKNVRKNIPPERVKKSLDFSKRKGFKTWAFFMIGLPGETEFTITKTIAFAKEADPDFAKFLLFKPFPGSEVYNEMNRRGLIDDFNFANYGIYTQPVHHLDNLTRADLLYWQKRAYREFYFRPKKIWDHIKRQKSICQLKLTIRGLLFVCFNAFKRGVIKRH